MSRLAKGTLPGLLLAAAATIHAPAALAADGKALYEKHCTVCHAVGIAGAPKLGDKALWKDRIAQGMDTLNMHAIKGFSGKKGMMPPKGGAMSLSDDQVKAAVQYMVDQAK
jgi:cytochrome c5